MSSVSAVGHKTRSAVFFLCFAVVQCDFKMFGHVGGQVLGEHKYLYELLHRLQVTRVSEAEASAKIVFQLSTCYRI